MHSSKGHSLNQIDVLCCIFCRGNVVVTKDKLICTVCKKRYSSEDDVLLFAPSEKGNDVALSESKWQNLHKDQQIDKKNEIELLINESYISFLSRYKNSIKKGYFLDLGCGVAWISAHSFGKRQSFRSVPMWI